MFFGKNRRLGFSYYPIFSRTFYAVISTSFTHCTFFNLSTNRKKLLRYADATFNHKNGFVYYRHFCAMRNLSTLQVHLSLEKSWIVTNSWYPHSELCSKIFWEGS